MLLSFECEADIISSHVGTLDPQLVILLVEALGSGASLPGGNGPLGTGLEADMFQGDLTVS